MLKGAELETLESRSHFKFDTRFRVLPKNYGVYDDEKVFDVEEIIVATDTLPFDDYITCRKWHLVSSVFWNDGWFEHVAKLRPRVTGSRIRNGGRACCRRWRTATRRSAASSTPSSAETKGELFPTPEACIEFYSRPENFDRLQQRRDRRQPDVPVSRHRLVPHLAGRLRRGDARHPRAVPGARCRPHGSRISTPCGRTCTRTRG